MPARPSPQKMILRDRTAVRYTVLKRIYRIRGYVFSLIKGRAIFRYLVMESRDVVIPDIETRVIKKTLKSS